MKRLVLVFCLILTVKAAAVDAKNNSSPVDAQFDQLAARYVDESPALSPIAATSLGDHRYDDQLDQVSEAARANERTFCQRYLDDLGRLDRQQLSRDRQVDYQLLSQHLRSQMWRLDRLQEWAWNPIEYTQMTGGAIYGLMAREFGPTEKRLNSVAARLEQYPRLYSQIRATLDPKRVPPIHAETALKQNRGVLSTIDNMVRPHLSRLNDADHQRLIKAIKIAEQAVDEHQQWMEKHLLPAAAGDAKLGSKLFDEKLAFALGTSLNRHEIRDRAEFELRRVRSEMYAIARRFQLDLNPQADLPENPSDEQQQKVIEFALEKAYAEVPARDGVVTAARKSLEIATEFVRRHDLVTIPDDPLEIIVMPEFQRGVAVAYCDSPGPLEVGLKTFYAVAPLPTDWSDAQCTSFLREYNIRSIHNLTVHEAMPGHFLQIALGNRNPNRLRSVLSSGTFVEGWACYTEQMMSEIGFLDRDPLMRLITLKWYLRTVANALLDQSVHVDGIRREDAMRMMMHDTFQEEREAAGKWTRAQVTSAQLSTYFVGVQEHKDLRATAESTWGAEFTMKRYHDAVVSYGSPAVRFVKALMLDEPIPETIAQSNGRPKPAEWTPLRMLQVKRIGSVQVSPDGKQVAFTVREAVMDNDKSEYLTHVHLADSDGDHSRQLTRGDKSCDDPQWSPDGETLALISARAGKKNLWLIRPNGGEATQLSHSKTDVTSFRWSPDGTSIAFTALDAPTSDEEQRTREKSDVRVVGENVKLNRLFVIPVSDSINAPRDGRQLTTGDLSVLYEGSRPGRAFFDWSPDGKTIAFSHNRTPAPDDWGTANLSLIDVQTGSVQSLCKTGAAESSPLFSPDGKSIAFVASDNPPTWGGRRTVSVMSTTDKIARQLAQTHDGFGRYSELLGWTADGKSLYFNEVQGTSLRLMNLPLDGSPVVIDQRSGMSLAGYFLNSRRTHFGFNWEHLNRPQEAFMMAAQGGEPVQVSQVHRDQAAIPLGRTEVIRWKSSDNTEVEGLLTYPVGYQPGLRYPLLLVIHGGPMGVFTQTFDGTATQYPVAAFASQGYAVLRPNPRGSSGYGQKFRYANYHDWGGGDYRDVMSGVDRVIALGVADQDRMGVMGWSYGGFMTSWIITQTDRFKAASVGAGVTNLMSFTGTADIPGFLPDYFGAEFWDNLETYRAHSAMFQVKGVTTPTLIQHGERDERVPLSQGQELYNALKRQGCTTKMVVYPRTPHGIEEPRLLLDCMQRNIEWFNRHLSQPSHPEATTRR